MIQGRDIVVTGLQNYNISIGSNCVNIAKEFAKHNRVLYVNYPLDRITSFRNPSHKIVKKQKSVIKGEEPSLHKAANNIWVLEPPVLLESISKIKPAWIFDILNKINNKRYAAEINRVISQLNFKDFILFEDGDIYRSF
ncbi:MAG: glycosyltransferase family 1 protein, partial [Bacteroidota bacterium]|nr:glycosyltransferase family 1 protein [Bacteroidota bacterium]